MCPEEYEAVKLQMSDEVKTLLEERHILEEEVKAVIYNAEATEGKLYQPEANRYLAQLRIAEATFCVEYSPDDGGYVIHSSYAYRSEIVE